MTVDVRTYAIYEAFVFIMEELKLEHLAPYLPYQLKGIDASFNNNIEVVEWVGELGINNCITYCTNIEFKDFEPILRPLKDLFKSNKGKYTQDTLFEHISSITSSDVEEEFLSHLFDFKDKLEEVNFEYAPWSIMQSLFKYHFDVFFLINKGLALDKNDI